MKKKEKSHQKIKRILCKKIDFNDGIGIYQLDSGEEICKCKIIDKDCKNK